MKMQKYKYKFEPNEPITNSREFTDELIGYCDKNNKELIINKEGIEPIVTIDNVKYFCRLEQPRMIDIPILPIYYTGTYGFKWVYIYECNMEV